jgi:hypothetical protein
MDIVWIMDLDALRGTLRPWAGGPLLNHATLPVRPLELIVPILAGNVDKKCRVCYHAHARSFTTYRARIDGYLASVPSG